MLQPPPTIAANTMHHDQHHDSNLLEGRAIPHTTMPPMLATTQHTMAMHLILTPGNWQSMVPPAAVPMACFGKLPTLPIFTACHREHQPHPEPTLCSSSQYLPFPMEKQLLTFESCVCTIQKRQSHTMSSGLLVVTASNMMAMIAPKLPTSAPPSSSSTAWSPHQGPNA